MKETIKAIILESTEMLTAEELTDDLQLITSGFIDSFEIIQMIDRFEQEFHVALPLEDIELSDFESVNDIERMLIAKGEKSA